MQGVEERGRKAVIEIRRQLQSFLSVKQEQEVIKRKFQRFLKSSRESEI